MLFEWFGFIFASLFISFHPFSSSYSFLILFFPPSLPPPYPKTGRIPLIGYPPGYTLLLFLSHLSLLWNSYPPLLFLLRAPLRPPPVFPFLRVFGTAVSQGSYAHCVVSPRSLFLDLSGHLFWRFQKTTVSFAFLCLADNFK